MPIHYQDHVYEQLLSWHCSAHHRVCDPFTPVTADDVTAAAARDGALSDGAFVVLARALRGADPTGADL
ncbi:MAG: hypothetical protein ACRD0V_18675 [Acidimicrobiales bacterium]